MTDNKNNDDNDSNDGDDSNNVDDDDDKSIPRRLRFTGAALKIDNVKWKDI